jgi:hypothetical protein
LSSEQLLITLWRRKWIAVLTVIVATGATYFLSRELPKVYSAQATLFVGDRGQANNDFEAIQSAQVLARTYAELIQSRHVARLVAELSRLHRQERLGLLEVGLDVGEVRVLLRAGDDRDVEVVVLEHHLGPLDVPAVLNLPLGHGKHLATIPLGVEVTVDADARRLVVEESALEGGGPEGGT